MSKIRNGAGVTKPKLWERINKIFLAAAFIHWAVTFFTDRFIFTYKLWDVSSLKGIVGTCIAWGVKAVFLVLLICIYQLLYLAWKKLRSKEEGTRAFLFYTLIYFAVMLVFMAAVWPGIWRMDEFGILREAQKLSFMFWQGYLTSLFYMLALMLLPFPAGVVLVQIAVISLIVGYLISKISGYLKGSRLVYLMYLPFLLLPVVDSNLYPMRMSVYAFLELLFVCLLCFYRFEKRKLEGKEILILSILTAVLTIWRTESFYYILLSPLTFLILYHRQAEKKRKLQFICLALAATAVVGIPQFAGNKLMAGDQYDITSVMLPVVPLTNEAAANEELELLSQLDRVLNVDLIRSEYQNGMSGIQIFWKYSSSNELIRETYSPQEYASFKRAYYTLIFKYPGVFLKERWETFINSNGLLSDSANLYKEDSEDPNYISFRENYSLNQPPSVKLRAGTIAFLECLSFEDYLSNKAVYPYIYSFIPQVILLVVVLFVLLFRRQWGYAFATACIAGKIPLIFITAPSRLFMYYYSVYLAGSVLAAVLVIYIIRAVLRRFR